MDKKSVDRIRNQKDLEYEKYILKKKLAKREQKLKKHFDELREHGKPKIILGSVVEQLGVSNKIVDTVLPVIIKYRKHIFNMGTIKNLSKSSKTGLLAVTAGIGVGILGYLLMKSKKKKISYYYDENDYQAYYDESDDNRGKVDRPNDVIF